MFDIYVRISDEGDRSPEQVAEQLGLYEATCREWAERESVEVGEVEAETNVSGSTAVAERTLERLIVRVETGESEGILTPYLDRFGRDTIEGCLAWKRIKEAGARLVCVSDSIDSDKPGSKLVFQLRLAIAEDYLDRVRANFRSRINNAASRGRYIASQPPLGYELDHETGRIHPHARLAPLVVEAFERRAAGQSTPKIAAWLREVAGSITVTNPKHLKRRAPGEPEQVYPARNITRNGIVFALRNRAYLGESRVQSSRKGEPRVIENAHKPLVTVELWERVQAQAGTYIPRDGSMAAGLQLPGLVYCSEGHRARATKIGTGKQRRPGYACKHEGCASRFAISADRLDSHVLEVVAQALSDREPHVAAIMEGDTRYQDALDVVTAAAAELRTFETDVSITDIGKEAWLAGREARQARVEVAREALRGLKAPDPKVTSIKTGKPVTFEEWAENGWQREHIARFVNRIVVRPVGRGTKLPASARADVYFVGADAPAEPKVWTAKQVALSEQIKAAVDQWRAAEAS